MQRRWGALIGLAAGLLALVPFATAGAQAPPTTDDTGQTVEGSIPPGGTVDCAVAPTLTPDHGPPGTEVTASADFTGNCDDVLPIFLENMECSGTITNEDLGESVSFPVDVIVTGEITVEVSGTFTAPGFEPHPPVVDAVEQLVVTITCFVSDIQQVSPEGNGGTTYVYPPATYADELFASPDTDQPTLVTDDPEPGVNPGVVTASPTFTG